MQELVPLQITHIGPHDLKVVGELDLTGAPAVRSALARFDADVTIDCSGITFIDASGLGMFVAAHNRCKARGTKLVLSNPPACMTRLLEITELDSVFVVERDGARW